MYDKKEKMSPNHKSHMRMHYATMTALVISNITVLGLGMLLSNLLLGDSLGNIYYMGEMQRLQKTQAAPMLITDDGGGTLPSRTKGGTSTSDPQVSTAPIAPTFVEVRKQVTFLKGVSIVLIWKDNSSDETGFIIERAMTSLNATTPTSTQFMRLDTTLANKINPYVYYEDSGSFKEKTKYWYRVKAYRDDNSESNYTKILAVGLTDLTPPSKPTGLRMTSVNCDDLSIAWNAATDNAGGTGVWGYTVEQDGEPGWSVYNATYANSPGALYAYTTHTYRVAAFDREYNLSEYSSSLVIDRPLTCPPVTPRNTVFTDIQSSSISFKWEDWSNNEDYFQISRLAATSQEVSTSTYQEIDRVEKNAVTYTDTAVKPGQRYCYVVRAYNSYGYSAGYSQDICEITPTEPGGSHSCIFQPYDGQNFVAPLSREATVANQDECLSLAETWKSEACTTRIYTNYLFYDHAQIHIGSGDCCCVSNNSCVFCSL